jgi:uncharacterized membrane protein
MARAGCPRIAGLMMTVVGVTFSINVVVLALASSQYTSRILRNFMRDRVTQVALGIFAARGAKHLRPRPLCGQEKRY